MGRIPSFFSPLSRSDAHTHDAGIREYREQENLNLCKPFYVCPHTTMYVSSCYYIYVLILFYICVLILPEADTRAATSRICGRIYSMGTHIYDSYIYIILCRNVPHTLPEDIHEDSSGAAVVHAVDAQAQTLLLLTYADVCGRMRTYADARSGAAVVQQTDSRMRAHIVA